jgi:hypothetical protein
MEFLIMAKPPLEPNLDAARRHLELLTGEPDPVVAFQLFSDSDKNNRRFARGFHGRFDDVLPRLIQAQEDGCGVFIAVNETDGRARRKENMTAARALFLDLDGAPLPDTWPADPDLVLLSSFHDGVAKHQVWWFIEPTTDWGTWQRMQKALVRRYGGDPKCTLTTQVGRLAGFFHLKRPEQPWQVQTLHDSGADPAIRVPLDYLVERFGFDLSTVELPRSSQRGSIDRPPPVHGWDADFDVMAARRLVSDPDAWATTSDGGVSIYQMACRLRDLGISEALAVDLIRQNVPVYPDSWPEDHVERKTRHAFRYAQNDAGAASIEADRRTLVAAFADEDILQQVDAEQRAKAAAMFGTGKEADHG